MTTPRRKTAYVPIALLMLVLFLPRRGSADSKDGNNFRESVIQCEEALSYLEDCCPGFDATQVACHYFYSDSTDCSGHRSVEHDEPDLSEDESACILDRSCNDLVTQGVCQRVATLHVTQGDAGAVSTAKVCP